LRHCPRRWRRRKTCCGLPLPHCHSGTAPYMPLPASPNSATVCDVVPRCTCLRLPPCHGFTRVTLYACLRATAFPLRRLHILSLFCSRHFVADTACDIRRYRCLPVPPVFTASCLPSPACDRGAVATLHLLLHARTHRTLLLRHLPPTTPHYTRTALHHIRAPPHTHTHAPPHPTTRAALPFCTRTHHPDTTQFRQCCRLSSRHHDAHTPHRTLWFLLVDLYPGSHLLVGSPSSHTCAHAYGLHHTFTHLPPTSTVRLCARCAVPRHSPTLYVRAACTVAIPATTRTSAPFALRCALRHLHPLRCCTSPRYTALLRALPRTRAAAPRTA